MRDRRGRRERLLLGVLYFDFPVNEIEKDKIGRSLVINRLGRGASRESGAFVVSGIKVNKMNLYSRGLVLLKIKARELTLGPEVRYRVCCNQTMLLSCRKKNPICLIPTTVQQMI